MITPSDLLAATIVFLIVFVISIEWKKWKFNKKLNGFIAIKQWPLFGCLDFRIGKIVIDAINIQKNMLNNSVESRAPLRFWIGSNLFIMPSDPDDLKLIFNSPACLNKPMDNESAECPNGLITARKEVWHNIRRNLNATFNITLLNRFVPILSEHSKSLCDNLQNNKGDAFHGTLVTTVFQQVIRTIFNSDYTLATVEAIDIYDTMYEIENYFAQRGTVWWYRLGFTSPRDKQLNKKFFDFLKKITHKQNEEVLNNLQSYEHSNQITSSQKIFFLMHNKNITERIAFDNIYQFFFASILTTTLSVNAAILLLAMHPKYQEKCVQCNSFN